LAWPKRLLAPIALHPEFRMMNTSKVRGAQAAGHRVNVWTVNEEADLLRAIVWRVDGIITDHPALARQLLQR